MMLQLLPALLASLAFLFFIIKLLKRNLGSKLPPGPRKLPLIGNLHQLFRSPLPYHSMTNLAKQHGPIMRLQLGEVLAVVISSPEAAQQVFKTNELSFLGRPIPMLIEVMTYGDSGLSFAQYGNHWREIRKICVLEVLSSKRVRSFRSVRENEVWSLIDSIKQASVITTGPINLTQEILQLNTRITCMAAFGYDCKDAKTVVSLLKEGMACAFQIADFFPSLKTPIEFFTRAKPKLNELHQRLDSVLDSIINEHKARRAANIADSPDNESREKTEDDLLDVLLGLHESNEHPISMINVKAIIWDIISGGTETSATTMDWAMAELVKHPQIMKKAQEEARRVLKGKTKMNIEECLQDLKYLRLVIKETLRLHAPIPISRRESTTKCKISGYEIPAKTQVILNVRAINTSKESWGDDADCFRPERFDGSPIISNGTCFQYLPFGSGRRVCPGISFSSAIMELLLGLLLCHFDWELPNGIKPEDLDMTEVFEISAKRKHHLHLIPKPLSSSSTCSATT